MATRYSIFAARAVFDGRLGAMDVRVLAAIGTYTDNEGWCFPSQKTLTERLDCSRSTLGLAIKKLVECGYLQVRARVAKGKGKTGNEYRTDTNLPSAQALETAPMSDAPDIGKKPAKLPAVTAQQVVEVAPMSDAPDIGPMSDGPDMPMSDLPDIGIYSLTTPLERPQSFLGKEPKKDIRANEVSGNPPKTRQTSRVIAAGSAPPPAKKRSPRKTYTDGFQTFWMMWPRQRRELSDKRKSFERWSEALAVWPEETILSAAKRYLAKPDVRKENFKYCRLAQVFLNGGLEAAIEGAQEKPSRVWSTAANAFVDA